MIKYYPAIIERSSSGYCVFFPDLPGCASAGDTGQEAARNAEEGLQAHIDLTLEYGELIPEPSEMDSISVEDDVDEAARVLVRAEILENTVQLNIPVSRDLLEAADRYAAQAGFTRAGLVSQALRDLLHEDRHCRVAIPS